MRFAAWLRVVKRSALDVALHPSGPVDQDHREARRSTTRRSKSLSPGSSQMTASSDILLPAADRHVTFISMISSWV